MFKKWLCINGFSCMGLLHRPLDCLHADAVDRADHMVVVFAVGAADQRRRDAGDRFHLVIAGLYIGDDLVLPQL